jgi:excinuclease ABC subunit C
MDKAKLIYIPNSPGVYIFKDKSGNPLYIGKARSLKKRVSSYFSRPQSLKIQIMTSKIVDLDYMVTKSEAQAQLVEAKLIKENLPPYNTAFRDDKSFPLICISNEDFPVVWVGRRTNRRLKDSAYYHLGPYTNAGLLRQALKSIRHIFGFRSCFKMPKRPCLYYRLRLCPAPCIGGISVRKYKGIIRNIVLFLEGKHEDLVNKLTDKMQRLAARRKFEEAAGVRNQIQALSSLSPRQYIGGGDIFRESVELKETLGLNIRPQRIEAFDVSNISGSSACASMVSFYEGRPDKGNYRRFRIKGVKGIDDYKMLEEAVGRRYRRLIDERGPLPDLIIIDGGKGQLNIVGRKLKELGLRLSVISIAKPGKKAYGFMGDKQGEKIFTLYHRAAIRLKPDSLCALRLIQRIRDEAHRFALAYHHILRRKKIIGK